MANFYVVATPIGNLEDITMRALGVLRVVDFIVCEDTRITKRLLERHGFGHKQLLPYNEKRSGIKIERIIDLLTKRQSIALVTDAGTPTISDPGARLVHAVRMAGFDVVAIPGPSALTAALSISGVPSSDFLFLGFLPHKKGRKTIFNEIFSSKRVVVFYESPHRILNSLENLNLGLSQDRVVTIVREISKIYEEVVSGKPDYVFSYFKDNKDKVRGEFVVIVS